MAGDGAAIFLQDATGMTCDTRSWRRLAEIHEPSRMPIALVIFENGDSELMKTGLGHDVGGGYHVFGFNINKIGQYLDKEGRAPELYKALFKTWRDWGTERENMGKCKVASNKTEGRRIALRTCQEADDDDEGDEDDEEEEEEEESESI